MIAAGLVGAALAYSGASYQGVFRNPLAGPFLLGVASGAALGAAVAIISPLRVDAYGFGWVPVFAFGGALATVVIVYLLVGRRRERVDNTTLILGGVALSAVFSAATAFILLTGGEQGASDLFVPLRRLQHRELGADSRGRSPYLVVGALIVASHARVLNVLQLDDEQAAQLGVDVTRTKLIVLGAASLMAATAVALAGVIGFVGLIVPHATRDPVRRRPSTIAAARRAAGRIVPHHRRPCRTHNPRAAGRTRRRADRAARRPLLPLAAAGARRGTIVMTSAIARANEASTTASVLAQAEDVRVTLGGQAVLRGVSLRVHAAEVLGGRGAELARGRARCCAL